MTSTHPTHTDQRPSFRTRAHHFGREPVVSNVTPLSRTQDHRFEREPVVLNISPSFRVWACHFEREPVIVNVSLLFQMSARRFECEPVVSNVSPSFRMSARRFKREPIISNVTHGWHSLWPWMQPSHGVQATSTVGTMYSAFVYKGTCNYIIYYYYVQDRSGTGRELVLQLQKTAWNRCGPVYDGSSLSFWEFEKWWTGLSPGLFKYGWKTGLDQTSKH